MRKTICEMCGEEFDEWDKPEQFGIYNRVIFGRHFDTQIIECDLCRSCFYKIVKKYVS